jgi:hypothetical protein
MVTGRRRSDTPAALAAAIEGEPSPVSQFARLPPALGYPSAMSLGTGGPLAGPPDVALLLQ